MEPQSAADLKKAYKLSMIIGLVMIGSLLIYASVVELIKTQNIMPRGLAVAPDVVALLRYVLLGVTVLELFAIRYLNQTILSAEVRVQQSSVMGPFNPEVQKLITAAIVTFALCESVAIYGLVLFLLGRNTTDFYLFLIISFFYFIVFFPRYGTWEEWLQEREKAARRKG